MPCTLINDLVNKWCGEVVFGTNFVQVAKVRADTDGALFLEDGNRVGHPSGVFNRINETSLLELINLDRKSTRLNSSHLTASRMPSSA